MISSQFIEHTVNLFNFASNLFSQYTRGRYFCDKLPWKFKTSIQANETASEMQK